MGVGTRGQPPPLPKDFLKGVLTVMHDCKATARGRVWEGHFCHSIAYTLAMLVHVFLHLIYAI